MFIRFNLVQATVLCIQAVICEENTFLLGFRRPIFKSVKLFHAISQIDFFKQYIGYSLVKTGFLPLTKTVENNARERECFWKGCNTLNLYFIYCNGSKSISIRKVLVISCIT